jgi:AcrR family transcriptional regulator
VAREAGVSHAAPTHHFGDLTGLVSELAAIGYRRFGMAMGAAATAAPSEHGAASARAYVGFARAHPGMYGLMFRTERLDMTRPSLREAASASFAGFTGAIAAYRGEQISTDRLTLEQAGSLTLAWSVVHGFTTLLLDGRLGNILSRLPEGADADALLEATLRATMRAPRGPGSAGPGSAGPGSAGPGSAGPGSAGPGSAGH